MMAVDRPFELVGKTVFVAGHAGMVGSALMRRLASEACTLLTASRQELDLLRQAEVEAFLGLHRPDVVIIAAAKVGGILANDQRPAEFLYENLMIEANLIHAAFVADAEKLLFLGSSCIYPRETPQPIREESLLSGPLESTNEGYAIAKIAGVKLCQAYRRQYGARFISAMPTNLYGPNDRYDMTYGHVIPSLLRRFHEATLTGAASVTCWGSGAPRREFLHVDDLADASVFMLRHYEGDEPINVGTGTDMSIRELAFAIAEMTGFKGEILWDRTKPDGTSMKRLDVSRLRRLGWTARIPFFEGLRAAYAWFLENPDFVRTSVASR
jgi:GDP-L-fucose synthase